MKFHTLNDLSLSLSLSLIKAGDKVGIMRLPEFNGSLVIFINGAHLGVIATNVAEHVYGFVEMQGDCERVAILSRKIPQVKTQTTLKCN
jgi:hypothetical protein